MVISPETGLLRREAANFLSILTIMALASATALRAADRGIRRRASKSLGCFEYKMGLRLFLFAALLLPATAFGQIKNGNFHQWSSGKIPDDWLIQASPPGTQDKISIEQTTDDNNPFLRITVDYTNTEVHISQSAKGFQAGKKYRLSFDLQRSSDTLGFVRVGFEPGPGLPNLRVGEFGKETVPSGDWEKYEAEFSIPEDADLTRWVFQLRVMGGVGSYGFRNIQITEIN